MSNVQYTPIIGIEIHVELRTNSKMFCGCSADHFGVSPNTHTCPVCLGLPGALPVANQEAIRRIIKIGLAMGCTIAPHSKFDRKNYFYPDLPKGYQISQYDQPFCTGGQVPTSLGNVHLERIHLEEDTAKLQHVTLTPTEMQQAAVDHSDVSLIDFNRSGVALVEIVTKPVIHSGVQAREYGKNLVQILRYLNVSDCDMEKGSLRLEANISVQTPDEKLAGQLPPYKVEVKNLNSFRFIERSINYEIERQSAMRDAGQIPVQETRGWRDAQGVTYSQRVKEDAADYRYFPDPDVPPIDLSPDWIAEIRATLPELPAAKAERWQKEYGISGQNAAVLSESAVVAQIAEQLLQLSPQAQLVANAIVNHKIPTWLIDEDRVTTATQAEIATEIQSVLERTTELYAVATVNEDEIDVAIAAVLADPAQAEAITKYKNGKIQVMGFLLGQVMKRIGQKVDTRIVQTKLQKALAV
jgi:aspartyl-tRNA(Asn)/glutamyl-tRNA(Gln) amidotransferase subunit B